MHGGELVPVNNMDERPTRKSHFVSAAAPIYHLNFDDSGKLTRGNPLYSGDPVRKVSPEIHLDIDPALIQPRLANPYAPPITNLPFPYAVFDTVNSTALPAYAY